MADLDVSRTSKSSRRSRTRAAGLPKHSSIEDHDDIDSETEQSLPMMPRPESGPVDTVPATPGVQIQVHAARPRSSENKMVDEDNKDIQPTGLFAWAGLGCGLFALATMCICFASPYWYQAYPLSFNEFRNIGLWEVCFHEYMHHKDDSQEIYSGCFWVFNPEEKYAKLREWLLPPWFIACQVMVTMALCVEILAVVIVAMVFLHLCPIMNHEYHQTYAMFAAASLMFLATMICLVTGGVFGAMADDRNWMPRPDLCLLSWGFGFLIISAIGALAAGAFMYLEARKSYNKLMEKEDEFLRAAMEMSGYPQPDMVYGDPNYPGSYGPPSYMGQPSYEEKQGYSQEKPSYSSQPSYSQEKPSFSSQPSYGQQSYDGTYNSEKSYGLPPKA